MELKRDEIIKALECCTCEGDATKSQYEICWHCPYFNEGNCTDILKENALSLIKELTAKTEVQDIVITELRKLLEKANHDADRYARKIKELTEENENLVKRLRHLLQSDFIASFDEVNIRTKEYFRDISEADELMDERDRYKRYYFNHCFDELIANKEADIKADTVRKMKSEIEKRCIGGGIYPAFVKSTIDQIAEEMTGEKND